MSFSIIAAVGEKLELGNKGGLVFNIREDMKFFKDTTMGHAVLMGLNTFNSIGRALPGRKNFVVSKTNEDLPDNVEVILDLEKFIVENRDTEEEIFVIGGGMIYRQLLPHAKVLYLTEVEATAEADVFFPEFNKADYLAEVLKESSEGDLKFRFVKYVKRGRL
ncbi:MAG: dihydrofolate reductase [Candidatus Saccharibacteria bacterium]|nr:dihydrofolate reductase [Candidatus Saccharibacteria bacterium]